MFSFRLHEFDEQVAAVREGMARVVPVPLLSLFTGYELETMVCPPLRAAPRNAFSWSSTESTSQLTLAHGGLRYTCAFWVK